MILPSELISEVKALRLSGQLEAVAMDVCNSLYSRIHIDKYLSVNKTKYKGKQSIKGVTPKNVNILLGKLVRSGILKRDFYIKKERSYHYRIAKTYKEFIVYNFNSPMIAIIQQKENRIDRYRKEKQEEYLDKMEARIKEIKWDMDTIWDWINNYQPTEKELRIRNAKHSNDKKYTMPQYRKSVVESMTYAMMNIKMRKYNFGRDKTTFRLHTPISNMKSKLLKKQLENLYEIDIRNSQPFLLKILIEYFVRDNKYNIKGLNRYIGCKGTIVSYIYSLLLVYQPFISDKFIIQSLFENLSSQNEVLRFSNIVDSGKFYDPFMDEFGLSRDESKVLLFKILFSKNESYKKDKQIFRKLYPAIFQFMEWIKEIDYTLLSVLLQHIESYIVIDVLSKKLVEVGIIPITKHDSIIIKPHEKEIALSMFKNVMLQVCGSIPSLKVKPLN